jgi:hypothetical protein
MLKDAANFLRGLLFPLHKPIFLVGCGKSGTTLLGTLLSQHPGLRPAPSSFDNSKFQSYLDSLTDLSVHGIVAHEMEEKSLWDKYFPINETSLRIGKELILWGSPLNYFQERMLAGELGRNLGSKRYWSKQPFNTFRIHALKEIFPDSAIAAIHRDGRDVVASWGREGDRWNLMGGYESALPIFCRKWNEAIEHIETHKTALDLKVLKYEDLVINPSRTLESLFLACDLEWLPALYGNISVKNRTGVWRTRIPEQYHRQLNALLADNLQTLGYEYVET